MTRRNPSSRGDDLERRFQEGRREAEGALAIGSRDLPILRGVTPACRFLRPQENVLQELHAILVNSGRVFRYGSDVVLEQTQASMQSLVTLVTCGDITAAAASRLANIVIGEEPSADPEALPIQFPLPPPLVSLAFNSEPLLEQLPLIQRYSKLPVFGEDFVLRGPGWHPDVGILVHGPEINPEPPQMGSDGEMIDRLPTHLRRVLHDFPFKAVADLANAVAAMLMAVLLLRYVLFGKPVILGDGNQPNVGKTWFMQVLAILLDGEEASPITFTRDDDEFGKRICAVLRSRSTSTVLIDNAKVSAGQEIDSAVLEAASVSPRFSARI